MHYISVEFVFFYELNIYNTVCITIFSQEIYKKYGLCKFYRRFGDIKQIWDARV